MRSYPTPGLTDVPLYVQQLGEGAIPCVLIHGYGEGGYVWEEFAPSLGERYSVLIPDLRGHGDSRWDETGKYSIRGHVQDVLEVVQSLQGNPVVLVGHSLGVNIAANIAVHHPLLVRALVLVDPSLDGALEIAREMRQNLLESLVVHESIAKYADWLAPKRPLLERQQLERIAARSLTPTHGGFRMKIDPALARESNGDDANADRTLLRDLSAIHCDTLLLRGQGSAVLTQLDVDRAVRSMRRAQSVTVEGAGHAIMTDNPQGFAKAVLRFLNTLLRSDLSLGEPKIRE